LQPSKRRNSARTRRPSGDSAANRDETEQDEPYKPHSGDYVWDQTRSGNFQPNQGQRRGRRMKAKDGVSRRRVNGNGGSARRQHQASLSASAASHKTLLDKNRRRLDVTSSPSYRGSPQKQTPQRRASHSDSLPGGGQNTSPSLQHSSHIPSVPNSPSSMRSNSASFQYVPKAALSPYQHVRATIKTQKGGLNQSQMFGVSATSMSRRTQRRSPWIETDNESGSNNSGGRVRVSHTDASRRRPFSASAASGRQRHRMSLGNGSVGNAEYSPMRLHSAQAYTSSDLVFINKNLASIRRREMRGKSLVEEKLSARGNQSGGHDRENGTTSTGAHLNDTSTESSTFDNLLEEIQEDFNDMHLTKHEKRKFTTLNSARSPSPRRPNTSAGLLSPRSQRGGSSPHNRSPQHGEIAETIPSPNHLSADLSLLSVPSPHGRPLSARALRSIDLLEKHHFSTRRVNHSRKRRRNPLSDDDTANEGDYNLEHEQVLDENIDRPVMMEASSSDVVSKLHIGVGQLGTLNISAIQSPNTPNSRGNSRNASPSSPRGRFATPPGTGTGSPFHSSDAPSSQILASGLIDYYEHHSDKRSDIFKKRHSPSIGSDSQSGAVVPQGRSATPPPLSNSQNAANNSNSSLGELFDSSHPVDAAKVSNWWKMLAKAISDARPKEDHNMALQKLMKIAIKKKEKEAVKAKQKMERSLVGLYKNKFLFTRRQFRALLGNINRERFSDEVDHQPVSVVQSPYKKRGDPADLLKKLTSKRAQIAEAQQQQKKNAKTRQGVSSRMAIDVHVKEFIPYTPEKEKIVSQSAVAGGSAEANDVSAAGVLSFSDLDSPQQTPQRPISAKHSRLATHSDKKRPRSAGATRKSKYRPPAANPASIVLEFQKMVFKSDPTRPKKRRPQHRQRSRIDNGVPYRKKEEKISVGILPTKSKA